MLVNRTRVPKSILANFEGKPSTDTKSLASKLAYFEAKSIQTTQQPKSYAIVYELQKLADEKKATTNVYKFGTPKHKVIQRSNLEASKHIEKHKSERIIGFSVKVIPTKAFINCSRRDRILGITTGENQTSSPTQVNNSSQ